MLYRLPGIVVIALLTLLLSGGCKKSYKGHFAGRPQRQIKQKEKVDKRDLNDCDQLEKQRSKKEKESIKRKKLISKEAEGREKIENNKTPLKEREKTKATNGNKAGGGVVHTGSNGIVFYLKIGVVVLLGLAAIGFAIGLIVFTLISVALSILLIPLLLTVGWFAIAGIAFAAISLVNQIRRRRMRRRKRRRRKKHEETDENEVPDDIHLEEEQELDIERKEE